MPVEAVVGMEQCLLVHETVAGDFGEDGGGGDAGFLAVSADDGGGGPREGKTVAAVDEEVREFEVPCEGCEGALHGAVRGGFDADGIDLFGGCAPDAVGAMGADPCERVFTHTAGQFLAVGDAKGAGAHAFWFPVAKWRYAHNEGVGDDAGGGDHGAGQGTAPGFIQPCDDGCT